MVKTLLFSIMLITHPVHVSLLSVDYAPEVVSFNVFLKIYYDDFLLDSGLKSENKGNPGFSGTDPRTRDAMVKYINDRINIYVNDQLLSGKLGDVKLSDGELNMNLIFSSVKRIRSITVKNLIMTSLYKDQANMVIVRVNDFEEGVKLTSDKTEQRFKIK
jgi:hypothetical protein